jgi:hypothetical protein
MDNIYIYVWIISWIRTASTKPFVPLMAEVDDMESEEEEEEDSETWIQQN